MTTSGHHSPDITDRSPGALVEAALTMLSGENIPLIPWGSLLFMSLNVPQFLLDYSFFVPDALLDRASHLVSTMGLPLVSPPSLLAKTEGELVTKARLHRLTCAPVFGDAQYFHLLPLSIADFHPSDLVEERHPSYSLLVPRQSAVYACIMRIMAAYPRGTSSTGIRGSLGSELELLVNYNLLELPLGYRTPDGDDDEAWQELDIDGRVDKAVCVLRNWGVEGEWREGEEWMQDALIAILRGFGASIEYLP